MSAGKDNPPTNIARAGRIRIGQHRMPAASCVRRVFDGILDRAWFANQGPLVRQLDAEFGGVVGTQQAVCLTNDVLAVALSTRALDLRGRVAVPARASLALVQGIALGGATPVLIDIDPSTGALDLEALERCTSAHAAVPFEALAAVPTTQCPELSDELVDFATRRGVPMLVEASEVLGSSLRLPEHAIGIYSFDGRHVVGAGQAAIAVTDSQLLAERLRWLRSFHGGSSVELDQPRLNGKLAEAPAALILAGLEELDARIGANTILFDRYRAGFARMPRVRVLVPPAGVCSNHGSLEVEFEQRSDAAWTTEALDQRGIDSERPLLPDQLIRAASRGASFAAAMAAAGPWPKAESSGERRLRLPLGAGVEPQAVDAIVELVCAGLGGQPLRQAS